MNFGHPRCERCPDTFRQNPLASTHDFAVRIMSDFAVLVLDSTSGAGLGITLEMLDAARELAPSVLAPQLRSSIYSMRGGYLPMQSGMSVETSRFPASGLDPATTIVVPGLALNTATAVSSSSSCPEIRFAASVIQAHVERGGRVAACHSAVFLLQFAGALDGKRATTAWPLADLLQLMNPSCSVDARLRICLDGLILTGGAAFAQTDVMLHLIREKAGVSLADSVARLLLVDARQSDSPFLVAEVLANGDALVSRLVAAIERALPESLSVSDLAKIVCMSERTLSRHVRKTTGQSTSTLVQSVKLNKARALLEQSRLSVENIAAAVGYSDSTALRRLMKRAAGASPNQYRSGSIASSKTSSHGVHAGATSLAGPVHALTTDMSTAVEG
jgi:transcriptional regulator GlxA family with amidase domain